MSWERGSLADFFQDNVIYRNLEPQDVRIPGLKQSWNLFGFDHYYVPRKTEPAYARALMAYVKQGQQVRGVSAPIERILFIGDTLMNDGTAARNCGQYLPMMGFIGADRLNAERNVDIQGDLMVANRWDSLGDYVAWVKQAGWTVDESTVLLIDLDKTSLGARGRNDHVIDGARVKAVQRTMVSALGDDFDEDAFRALYDPLNQPDYHYFTADNQDYLAYICLMISGGVYTPDELWARLEARHWTNIGEFASACQLRRKDMSGGLGQAQDEVMSGIANQDPTPFKGFRRGEYFETIAAMDVLGDSASVEDVLDAEIVITNEVASLAKAIAAQGALVFGISDKPDEASVPQLEDQAKGKQAIHRTTMKLYGREIGL